MRTSLVSKFLLLSIASFFLFSTYNGKAQSVMSEIDSLLVPVFDADGTGGTFLVAKDGQVLYRKAFGNANLELDIPMQPEHVFNIGSMTKQFTAIGILMLEEQGLLSLTDEITKYIPDYPTLGTKITLHHLLTHTSGIKSFTSISSIRDLIRQDIAPIELIDLFKEEPMDFLPGEAFKYNNSGYFILGYIIEIVSGKPYSEYIEEQLFQKINMTASRYASHSAVIKNRASGYHQRDKYTNNRYISYTLPYASGSLMSTVDDMLKWQEAIKNNLLINEATTQKVFTNYTLNNGEPINYGYGWHIKDLNGLTSTQHGGSIFGYKSMAVYVPQEDLYVIGLTNCDCISPTKITKEIAGLVLDAVTDLQN